MRALLVLFTVLLLVGTATAHEGQLVDLRTAPPDHQVAAVGYCGAKYEVKLKDGVRPSVQDRLRPEGPGAGGPVLIRAGMAGDRAFVVFSGPEEMKDFLKRTC